MCELLPQGTRIPQCEILETEVCTRKLGVQIAEDPSRPNVAFQPPSLFKTSKAGAMTCSCLPDGCHNATVEGTLLRMCRHRWLI